jgi:hypothetical protein
MDVHLRIARKRNSQRPYPAAGNAGAISPPSDAGAHSCLSRPNWHREGSASRQPDDPRQARRRSRHGTGRTYPARIKRLTREEIALLREAVAKHQPDLLPVVERVVNGRRLTNVEGNALRYAVGREISAELDPHSVKMDDLIDRIGQMMEWR